MPALYHEAVRQVFHGLQDMQRGSDLRGLRLVMSPETWDALLDSGLEGGHDQLFFGIAVVLEPALPRGELTLRRERQIQLPV